MVKDIFQLARAGIAFEYEPVHKVHFMPPAPSVMIAEKENRKEGVHINYPEKDESENETYGNGRMSELKGMIFSEAQFYNPDEDKECTEIFIDSVIIEDNGEYLHILLGTKTNN